MKTIDPNLRRRSIVRALYSAVALLVVIFGINLANHIYTGGMRAQVKEALRVERSIVDEGDTGAGRPGQVIAVDQLRSKIDKLYIFTSILNVIILLALLAIIIYLYKRLQPLIEELISSISSRDAEIEQRRGVEVRNVNLIQALEAKNKELDHFAYIASHDLQEPLRTVSNFIELLEEEQGEQAIGDSKIYFKFINQATQRMRDLITNLLQYSQLGRRGITERVDLTEAALAAVENLSLAIREKSATVTVDKLPTVNGHPTELIQLFQNLIANAVKFTATGQPPVIRVFNADPENCCRVSVSDNGIGIEDSARDKIFNMFSRVHAAGAFGGQGIGLNFCSRIVQLHGGDITFESTPGQGTTFTFSLQSTTR